MKTKLKLGLAGLLMVTFAAGCASKRSMTNIGNIFVVRVADDGTVDQPSVTLSASKGDRVIWVSEATRDLDIQFDEPSPFENHPRTYTLPAKKFLDPRNITNGNPHGYNYNVMGKAPMKSGAAGDPAIIITK